METIIKLSPAELNPFLLEKIKRFIGNKGNVDVIISIKEYDPEYADALDRSISEVQTGDVISMTMEEFVAYIPKNK